MKTRRERIAAIVCILLHIAVLVNVYIADQHTPRIIASPIKVCAHNTFI